MSEQDPDVVTTTTNEDAELENEQQDTEDVEALKSQIEKEKTAKQQILARAKKAEAELKALKGEKPEPTQTTSTPTLTADDVDLRVLKLQGMSDEMLDKLKTIAKATGKTLIDAQQDEIFVAIKTKAEADIKAEKARLGASRGSGSVKKEKNFSSSLSDQEHKELWRAAQGR